MRKTGPGSRKDALRAMQILASPGGKFIAAKKCDADRRARRRAREARSSRRVISRRKDPSMPLSHRSILLAAGLALLGATQAFAGKLCKPVLSLRDARISEAHEMHRTWTGVLVTDSS